MNRMSRSLILLAGLAGLGVALAGCADENQLNTRMANPDFGRAYHEDFAAQIADPDATYKGPPPASSGERAAVAQRHYQTDTVKQPASTGFGGSGGGSGGGGGGGGGTGGGGGS